MGGDKAWNPISEIKDGLVLVRSVGFVVKETKKTIYVSHTADAEECTAPFAIVRSAIISKKELKLPPTPNPQQ